MTRFLCLSTMLPLYNKRPRDCNTHGYRNDNNDGHNFIPSGYSCSIFQLLFFHMSVDYQNLQNIKKKHLKKYYKSKETQKYLKHVKEMFK